MQREYVKLPGGYTVEAGRSVVERLGTAPVPGWNYPTCRECGWLRAREVDARVIHDRPALVMRLRARQERHIRDVHPETLPACDTDRG